MNKKIIFWSLDTAKQEANKYKNKSEFKRQKAGAYNYLKKNDKEWLIFKFKPM
jgi:hypothetical protein